MKKKKKTDQNPENTFWSDIHLAPEIWMVNSNIGKSHNSALPIPIPLNLFCVFLFFCFQINTPSLPPHTTH